MRTQNTPETFIPELRRVSSAEIAQIIKDARLMRAQAQAELLRSAGRGIARLGRPVASAIGGLDLTVRLRQGLQQRRAYLKTRAELETYSARELAADLRLNRSDIPELAAG
ncbi:MAG: hypothetical protein K0R41_2046 [Geminicoccaceae bacterium]|jgi:uncharacterized protein YjiS (DUF1127 family)|nr:hypothetical protein [Geminicoccaceae bacterium]MCE3248221.1 hypothetical protein [Geminicoccaceae bacterium]